MTEINLIPEEQRVAEGYESLHKKLSTAALVLLILAAVSTLGILIFFTVLVSRRNALVSQIQDSSARINSLKETEDLVFVIKGKAMAADKLLSLRLNYPDVFSRLSQLIPQNVYFTDLSISGQKMSIAGKAKTSADMAGLISQLTGAQGSEMISGVSIGSLSSDQSGNYQFTLSAQVNKPKG